MKRIILILFLIKIMSVDAQRQSTDNYNGWFMYFGDHKFADKWGVHIEAQLRRNEVISKGQQLLLRTGLNYHFNPNVFATVGYCFVETYPYGEFAVKSTFPEHRFWEQVQMKSYLSKIEWVSRFRLEQRFSQLPVNNSGVYEPGDAIYSNRFRLLNRFSVPFKGDRIVDNSFYLSAYDELMIGFGEHVGMNLFDQNRAYIALGYKIPKIGRLELGYMNQIVIRPSGLQVEYNHNLQVGISSTLDFYKPKSLKP